MTEKNLDLRKYPAPRPSNWQSPNDYFGLELINDVEISPTPHIYESIPKELPLKLQEYSSKLEKLEKSYALRSENNGQILEKNSGLNLIDANSEESTPKGLSLKPKECNFQLESLEKSYTLRSENKDSPENLNLSRIDDCRSKFIDTNSEEYSMLILQSPEDHLSLELINDDFEKYLKLENKIKDFASRELNLEEIISNSDKKTKEDQKVPEATSEFRSLPILLISKSISKGLPPEPKEHKKHFRRLRHKYNFKKNLTRYRIDHVRSLKINIFQKLQRTLFYSRLSYLPIIIIQSKKFQKAYLIFLSPIENGSNNSKRPQNKLEKYNTKHKARRDSSKFRKPKKSQNKKPKPNETNRKTPPKKRNHNNISGLRRRKRIPFTSFATNRDDSNPFFQPDSGEEEKQKGNRRNEKDQDDKNNKQKNNKILKDKRIPLPGESSQRGPYYTSLNYSSQNSINERLASKSQVGQKGNFKESEPDPGPQEDFDKNDFKTIAKSARRILILKSALEKRKSPRKIMTDIELKIFNHKKDPTFELEKNFTTDNESKCFEIFSKLEELGIQQGSSFENYFYGSFAKQSLGYCELMLRVVQIKIAIEFIDYLIAQPKIPGGLIPDNPDMLIKGMIKKANELWDYIKLELENQRQIISKPNGFGKILTPFKAKENQNVSWEGWEDFLKRIEIETKQLFPGNSDRELSYNNTPCTESHSTADQVDELNHIMDQLEKPKKKIKRDPSAYLQTDQNQLNCPEKSNLSPPKPQTSISLLESEDELFSLNYEDCKVEVNFLGLFQIPDEDSERIQAKINDFKNLESFEF